MLANSGLFALSLAVPVLGETILGVTVFSRHGDRTTKHYSGYGLTNLGFQQNYQVGGDYRNIYLSSQSEKRILNISENQYVPSQIYASAPDQKVLLNTATAFMQGLYAPLEETDSSIASQPLNNGSEYTNPLNGYQYVVLHGANDNSPDTIWIKGDDGCPAVTKATKTFANSEIYQDKLESTRDFYGRFWNILDDVYDYKPENMTYANAYDIFDLINVASIHNESSPARNVSSDDLFQLRTLADSWEFHSNFNESQPARSIGGQTLAGGLLAQINQTVATSGKLKFSLLAGSYDTFMAFFSLANLTDVSSDFYGLAEYASTMAFEVFTPNDITEFPADSNDLRVRFLFRNGSDDGAALNTFPLFGSNEDSLSWADFEREMGSRAITDVGDWCGICESKQDFCQAYTNSDSSAATESKSSGMSNTVAGVIGAMVTLGVVALIGAAAWLVLRKRGNKQGAVPVAAEEKSLGSGRSV